MDKMEKMERWIKALNIALRLLFPNERRHCDLVSLYLPYFSLGEVCRELNAHLLRFVKTLNRSHLSHVIPKVFKALSDLIPNFNSLSYGQNDAVDTFEELKTLIHSDAAQAAKGADDKNPWKTLLLVYENFLGRFQHVIGKDAYDFI
ncbi:Exocyst complex component EXO70B1, partial [Mucuna pruriens]